MDGICSMHGRDEKFIRNYGHKHEGKRALARSRRRVKDNIEMNLKEIR
jgi:hypothetical protein